MRMWVCMHRTNIKIWAQWWKHVTLTVVVTDPWSSLFNKSSKLMGFRFSEKRKREKNISRWRVAEERHLIPTSALYRCTCTYDPHQHRHTPLHTHTVMQNHGFPHEIHTQMCVDDSHSYYPLSPIPRWSLSIFNTLKELLWSLPSQYLFIAPVVCNDSLFHSPKAPLGMSCLYIIHSHLFGWDIVALLSFLDV